MEYRVFSDLHLDKQDFCLSRLVSPEDKKRGLIIAGDICTLLEVAIFNETLDYFARHFKFVIYVMGNHEYSFQNLFKAPQLVSEIIQRLNHQNIFVLNNQSLVLEGVLFLGSTLWTDLSQYKQQLIRKPHEKIKPFFSDSSTMPSPLECFTLLNTLHQEQREWLFAELRKENATIKAKVVISHHAPSFNSTHPEFAKASDDYFYASDLENDIKKSKPTVWIHGHTHCFCNYQIGKTQILSNPLGLPRENTGFRKNCIIDL